MTAPFVWQSLIILARLEPAVSALDLPRAFPEGDLESRKSIYCCSVPLADLRFQPIRHHHLSHHHHCVHRFLTAVSAFRSFSDGYLVANLCVSGPSVSDDQPNRQSFPSLSNSRHSPSNLPRAIPPFPGLVPFSLGSPAAVVRDSCKSIHRPSELGNFADPHCLAQTWVMLVVHRRMCNYLLVSSKLLFQSVTSN
jgi:hypothetical protein